MSAGFVPCLAAPDLDTNFSKDEFEKASNVFEKPSTEMLDKILDFQTKHFEVLPASLHHYGRARTAITSTLKSREMWASHAYDMADKEEVWHGADIAKERIALFRERYAHQSTLVAKFFERHGGSRQPIHQRMVRR